MSFYWDDNLIGVESVTVSGGSTEDAVMEWKAVGGSHVINVTVDQEQQVNESNEDNNIALREITVAYPPVLFLDDDSSENNGGYSTETDPYYINSLDNLTDIAYDTIVVEYGEDGPGSDTLNAYDMIIWACGADLSYTFTENDRDNISGFLDDGGSMWVIGQDILWDLNSGDGSRYEGDFEYDYLGVSQVDHDTYTPEIILGVDGDPISEGVNYGAESIGSDYADDIDPREGFEKILNSEDNDYSLPWFNTSSTRTEDDFKLVFMTVDFSSFTESDDRDEFLS